MAIEFPARAAFLKLLLKPCRLMTVGNDVYARYAVMSACIFMQESGWYHGFVLVPFLEGRVFLLLFTGLRIYCADHKKVIQE